MSKQHIHTTQAIDYDTGEVKVNRTITRETKNIEHFTRLYINDIARLGGISGAEAKFLFMVHQYVEYNTNEFFISHDRKNQIALESGLKINTINCCISRLTRKKFLIKKSSNHYQLNPQFFFYGTEIERSRHLELTIEYRITDKESEVPTRKNIEIKGND